VKNQLRITSKSGSSDAIPAIGVDVEVLERFVLIAEVRTSNCYYNLLFGNELWLIRVCFIVRFLYCVFEGYVIVAIIHGRCFS
jgi:hypothetical protein